MTRCRGRFTAGQDSTDKRLDEIVVVVGSGLAYNAVTDAALVKTGSFEENDELSGSLKPDTEAHAHARVTGVAERSVLRFRIVERRGEGEGSIHVEGRRREA